METILGIKGKDFVMLAADCTQAHSIITLKEGKFSHFTHNSCRIVCVQHCLT